MEHICFTTLTEAITYVFQKEQLTILSLDRICQGLAQPNLYLQTASGLISCDTISRRRVSSILSSSELFVRAGPPRSCMWTLKPSNPLCLSDGALLSCINTILTENGPLSANGIIEHGDLTGATSEIISDFLVSHENEYQVREDGCWWFKNQPLPEKWEFDSVVAALTKSFHVLMHEASIEELNWLLCLSTLPQGKKISRRKISRELSRRPDLFQHISRAKYAPTFTGKGKQQIMISNQHQTTIPPQPILQQQQLQMQSNQQLQQMQQGMTVSAFPTVLIQNNANNNNSACQEIIQDDWKMPVFESFPEQPKMMDFNIDWSSHLVPKCETPPLLVNDFFDADEFFSVGFANSF